MVRWVFFVSVRRGSYALSMRCKSAERAESVEQIIHEMGMDSDYSTFTGSLAFELSNIPGESRKLAPAFPHHHPGLDVNATESSKIVFVRPTRQNSEPTSLKYKKPWGGRVLMLDEKN